MAITTSPLLSLDASGSIGKTLVYSKWKGISYARQHVTPANPNTVAQQGVRNVFRWVHDSYKFLDSVVTESWVNYAKGKPLTPANAWQSANMTTLNGQSDITDIIFSKPSGGAPPATTITATGGTLQVTVAGAAPTPPAGWTVVEAIAIAMENVDPTLELEAKISGSGTDTTAPYSIVITGLKASTEYVCGIWFKFMKADGTFAYGGQLTATASTS